MSNSIGLNKTYEWRHPMKKIATILIVTMFIVSGCTRLPASQETGVIPGEYKSSNALNYEEVLIENDKLKIELEQAQVQLQKLKDDYLNIARNNDMLLGKLNGTESILKQLEDEESELPKFVLEQTDKDNIIQYIKERKTDLSRSFKDVKIIALNEVDNIIMFYTVGYGENINQIFIWEVGKSEPIIVNDAVFNKDGSWDWLLQDKYILIDSGKDSNNEKKILDINEKRVISAFEAYSDGIYLIPNTTSIIMKKPKINTSTSMYQIFDFTTGEEKKINFEFQDKDLKINMDNLNNAINFISSYVGEDDMMYFLNVTMDIDKLIEKYSIKTLDELK